MQCQICYTDLSSLSTPDRQTHYELHFSEPAVKASTSTTPRQSEPSSSKNDSSLQSHKQKQKRKNKWKSPFEGFKEKVQDVFWYQAMESPPPDNFTPGLIPLLRKALLKSHAQGNTVRAVLCYERTTLINGQMWDIGWGCGYRNFLMACSALMDQQLQPLYFPLLDQPTSPGVRNLQRWIEEAWRNGYDQEGYQQLHKLVDTNKWIGTSGRRHQPFHEIIEPTSTTRPDLCTAFVYRGIPAELADFDAEGDDIRPLTKWIVEYFDKHKGSSSNTLNEALSGASPVQCVPCMPLVLQNAGHSRLVVGYEMVKGGVINLLIFDPSTRPNKTIRKAALDCHFAYSQQRTRGSSSPGEKRRLSNEFEEIVFLGQTNQSDNKRQKMAASRRNGASSATPTSQADADDEIVFVRENRNSGSKATSSPGKIREDDSLWKDVLKLCKWQDKKVK
ncbi:hypothetical protein V5O48_004087 [Marasmius crinis-equi]|uniref:UFSP1/2/DUB catalytic domain-containing protein n=1 Tax=Marasmius crinis-equi TaxID=585013 RepID=A0ABR3FR37_9AGAR